jgi:hypothetical protein
VVRLCSSSQDKRNTTGKSLMKNKHIVMALFFAALIIPREYSFYYFPAAVIYLAFLDIYLFRFVRKISFLILVIMLTVLQPLFMGEKDLLVFGINFSTEGFYNGLMMVMRAVVMIPSISYLSKTVDRNKLRNLFGKIGIKNFDEIFQHSQQMLPVLTERIKSYFASENKKYFNPIEFTARFFAFIIKSVQSYSPDPKEEKSL